MEKLIFIVHIFVCFSLIGLILLQQGKGAEVGASFGSGASQTVFGSQGSGNFMTHTTALLAAIFFATCLGLGYWTVHRERAKGIDTMMHHIEEANRNAAPVSSHGPETVPTSDIPVVPTLEENKDTP